MEPKAVYANHRLIDTSLSPIIKSYFKEKILSQGGIYLDSNQYKQDPYSKYQFIAGLGIRSEFQVWNCKDEDPIASLRKWHKEVGFCLGLISYDFKNCLEKVDSQNPSLLSWPLLHFIQPECLIYEKDDQMHIYANMDLDSILASISTYEYQPISQTAPQATYIKEVPDKKGYLDRIHAIKQHIIDGDVYELNYCRHFEIGLGATIDVSGLTDLIIGGSSAPFSGIFKSKNQICISASPERFFCKRGDFIYSQPIKGTIERGNSNEADELKKLQLLNSEKDRAENIMIVDLVRNDLSRVCSPGTVQVEELFGIYSFTGVHQMISTVSGILYPGKDIFDMIGAAFPMGSMTGAPKVRAMELIEAYEDFQRGAFSGSLGYIDFDGDGDFNVVIRTLLINLQDRVGYLPVGGAIVFDSDPEEEYQESLLKASRILHAFDLLDR